MTKQKNEKNSIEFHQEDGQPVKVTSKNTSKHKKKILDNKRKKLPIDYHQHVFKCRFLIFFFSNYD